MIGKLLEIIFSTKDAESAKDDEDKQFEIISEKFKYCGDLAKTCKLTPLELLRFSSRKIFSQITKIVMMNKRAIHLIEYFIGVEFFKKYILPKSWFYLIQNDEISSAKIEKDILQLEWEKQKLITEADIKRGLFECIAQTACSKKLSQG